MKLTCALAAHASFEIFAAEPRCLWTSWCLSAASAGEVEIGGVSSEASREEAIFSRRVTRLGWGLEDDHMLLLDPIAHCLAGANVISRVLEQPCGDIVPPERRLLVDVVHMVRLMLRDTCSERTAVIGAGMLIALCVHVEQD